MKKNWTCEETPKSKFLLLVRKRIHPNGWKKLDLWRNP
jgi:hypothetical protein